MSKIFLAFFLFFFLQSFLASAGAYIPSYSLIMSHIAYYHGRGGYRIEQELSFKRPASFSLKEIWWIKDPAHIRLDVKSPLSSTGYYLRFIYGKDKKWFKDAQGRLQSQPISYYHIERPFHLRGAKALRKLFSLWGVAPFNPAERKTGAGSDPFVRLSRKGGATQYEIGTGRARVWVKQDEFVIHSWKWKTGESLSAWNYKLYPGHFFFPSRRLFRGRDLELEIKLLKVQSLKLEKKWFHKSRLKANTGDQNLPVLVQDTIHEFYKKFR